MTKNLTVELHEQLYNSLEAEASRQGVTLEMLAREYLSEGLIRTVERKISCVTR